jgi:hypothetical protein
MRKDTDVHLSAPAGSVKAYASRPIAPRKVKINSNHTLRFNRVIMDLLLPFSIAPNSVSSLGLKPSFCFFHISFKSSISI